MQSAERFSLGPRFIRLAVPLGLVLLAAALSLSTRELEAHNRNPLVLEVGPLVRYSALAVLPSDCTARIAAARVPVQYTLARGETLAQVLRRLGVSGEDTRQALAALAEHVSLRRIKAGNRYSAFFNPDSTLASVDLTLAGDGRVEMNRDPGGLWRLEWLPFRRSIELRMLQGAIDGAMSLDAAVRRAGGPPGLSIRMSEALRWDLDFAHDLRQGDRFKVLYEVSQVDGKDHAAGIVVALSYDNQGRRHEAYRYGDGEGFYDAAGRPMQKMFLRSPLRYAHVTSAFSHHRFHPVLGEVLPHYGIDYGAPVGTPVEATASGMVVFAGWDGGGGNVVKLQHGTDYVTAYLHLSRFAPGIHPGARVRQGDTIAYTGATGLATGPHLDYRVKYRGAWIDPLSLHGVRDEPISQARQAAFGSWRDTLRTALDQGVVPASLSAPAGHGPATLLARLVDGTPGLDAGRESRPGRSGRPGRRSHRGDRAVAAAR